MTLTASRSRHSVLRATLLGGLVAGTLDILDPIVVLHFRGVAAIRIPQSIAGGLLGRAAFSGGWKTAVLGVALHFTIATTAAAVYVMASRALPVLARRPIVCGAVYGVGVFVFMNYVVVPLSAAGRPAFSVGWLVNALFAHTVLVGQPIAYFARRARL